MTQDIVQEYVVSNLVKIKSLDHDDIDNFIHSDFFLQKHYKNFNSRLQLNCIS